MLNLTTIGLIIKNTIDKEWRSRALIFLSILTLGSLLVIGAVITLLKEQLATTTGMDVVGDQAMNAFFWSINFWNVFLSFYFGISTITSDRESGVVVQLLSFPMTRLEYLVGRILGCWCVILFYFTFAIVIGMSGISLSAGAWIGGTPLIWAFGLSSLTWLAAITIAIFVATYLNKLAALISVMVINSIMWWSTTYFTHNPLKGIFESFSIPKIFGALIYSLFPHVSYWSAMVNEKLFSETGPGITTFESLHFVGSYLFLVLLLWQIFRRKEL